jgi:predicted molibdopterin-dependent oxidoreductase YjgC
MNDRTRQLPRAAPQMVRLAETGRDRVAFTLDGTACEGLLGDTVLTAMLVSGALLRHSEFSGEARAGFCLMGACQDCWVDTDTGQRLRACSTALVPGMRLRTRQGLAP